MSSFWLEDDPIFMTNNKDTFTFLSNSKCFTRKMEFRSFVTCIFNNIFECNQKLFVSRMSNALNIFEYKSCRF